MPTLIANAVSFVTVFKMTHIETNAWFWKTVKSETMNDFILIHETK